MKTVWKDNATRVIRYTPTNPTEARVKGDKLNGHIVLFTSIGQLKCSRKPQACV